MHSTLMRKIGFMQMSLEVRPLFRICAGTGLAPATSARGTALGADELGGATQLRHCTVVYPLLSRHSRAIDSSRTSINSSAVLPLHHPTVRAHSIQKLTRAHTNIHKHTCTHTRCLPCTATFDPTMHPDVKAMRKSADEVLLEVLVRRVSRSRIRIGLLVRLVVCFLLGLRRHTRQRRAGYVRVRAQCRARRVPGVLRGRVDGVALGRALQGGSLEPHHPLALRRTCPHQRRRLACMAASPLRCMQGGERRLPPCSADACSGGCALRCS